MRRNSFAFAKKIGNDVAPLPAKKQNHGKQIDRPQPTLAYRTVVLGVVKLEDERFAIPLIGSFIGDTDRAVFGE